jgi:spore germination protein (amino acid permease)
MKQTNQQPFLEWLQQRYGKVVSWGFRLFFIAYLFCMSLLTLKDTIVWAHVTYLPRTPQLVISLTLILTCYFAVLSGIRAIAITAGILLPFVIIFGDFVMSANLPEKNYSLMLPVFENGIGSILSGTIYIGGGLAELMIILLMQHQIKTKVRLWSLYILVLFLIMLIFGPVTGAIAEFGPFEAAQLRYPAYEEWRLVTIGHYIQHVDFLSIYQWLSGAFIRISISLFLLVDLLAISKKKNYRTAWLLLLSVVFVFVAELPISDMQYLSFMKHVYFPVSLWLVSALTFILFLMLLMSKKNEVRKNEA